MSAPTLDEVYAAALRIRAQVWPLAGPQMNNDEACRLTDLEHAQLDAWGIPYDVINQHGSTVSGRHVWFTVLWDTGSPSGRWADNEIEAALCCATSWGRRPVEVREDEGGQWLDTLRRGERDAARIVKQIEAHQAEIARRYDGSTPATGGLLDLI